IWGPPDMLTFSQPISYWFWFGLVFSIQLLSWIIILDALKWSIQFFSHLNRARVERWYRRFFIVLSVLLFCYTGVKMWHDTNSIQIKRYTYASPEVSAGLDGFRIVHITDLQGDEYTGRDEMA